MTRNGFRVAAMMTIALSLSQAQAGARKAGGITVADEGRRTLEDLQASATRLESEADQFRTVIANHQLDSEAHLVKLEALKEEINKMGRELGTLRAEQEALPSWEQQAVARTVPLLKDSAADTDGAIRFFNDNRSHLWAGVEYRNYADHIWQDSEQMAKSLKNYLELAKLRLEEQQLNARLGLAGGL